MSEIALNEIILSCAQESVGRFLLGVRWGSSMSMDMSITIGITKTTDAYTHDGYLVVDYSDSIGIGQKMFLLDEIELIGINNSQLIIFKHIAVNNGNNYDIVGFDLAQNDWWHSSYNGGHAGAAEWLRTSGIDARLVSADYVIPALWWSQLGSTVLLAMIVLLVIFCGAVGWWVMKRRSRAK